MEGIMKKKTADITSDDIRKQFHKIYYSDIAPQMIEYEKRRKKEIFKLVLIELVLIFVATGLIYYYLQTVAAWMLILFILSIIKPSLNITDPNIITPVSIPINIAISGLSFLITKQSVVDIIAIPIICITSNISPPL